MQALLRILASLFKGKQQGSVSMKTEIVPPVPANSETRSHASRTSPGLSEKLASASHLLIVPTSETVYEAGLVLDEVQTYLRRFQTDGQAPQPGAGLEEIHLHLQRLRSLAEGAQRVQWTQMRTVMALTQCYAPGGRISQWQPNSSKVDVKV